MLAKACEEDMCVERVCVCARAGAWGWETEQPGNRLRF